MGRSFRTCATRRRGIPRASIEKEPSAELAPHQKDSDTLPPYEKLDPLIEALVDRSLSVPMAARRARTPVALTALLRAVTAMLAWLPVFVALPGARASKRIAPRSPVPDAPVTSAERVIVMSTRREPSC